MTERLQMFIPLRKADAARRMVYGYATAETPDRAGEICDYASTKPHYQAWSKTFAKATDGKSLGNVRAMHGAVAAGKIASIRFNDEEKRIEIAAKIIDDDEWRKVEEGVYTGFSQGGAYLKRWPDPENPDLIRYTAKPSEISLVDLPCLPEASFELVKADGASETRAFAQKTPTAGERVVARQHRKQRPGRRSHRRFFRRTRTRSQRRSHPRRKPQCAARTPEKRGRRRA